MYKAPFARTASFYITAGYHHITAPFERSQHLRDDRGVMLEVRIHTGQSVATRVLETIDYRVPESSPLGSTQHPNVAVARNSVFCSYFPGQIRRVVVDHDDLVVGL